jgi:hypothetical protein
MSVSPFDDAIKAASDEYFTARNRLTGLIEQRIAKRVREHWAEADDVRYEPQPNDTATGWVVTVIAVMVHDEDVMTESLDEEIGEESAREIENDLEYLCDLDADYAEMRSLYMPEEG